MKKVVMFSASWCGPCRQAKPVFNEISKEFEDVNFSVVDIDENHKLATDYNISGVPTFIILNEDTEIDRVVGGGNVRKIRDLLRG